MSSSVHSLFAVGQFVTETRERLYRGMMVMLLITASMSFYMARLAHLQIVQGAEHRQRAEENRIRYIPLPSDRGKILDRNGKLLAANSLSRSLYLWPREQPKERWLTISAKLSTVLKIPKEEILQKLAKVDFNSTSPIRIAKNLSEAALVVLSERTEEFPGIEIRTEFTRDYPNGNLAAHVLGYIGEANQQELEANPRYPLGIKIGKMGIEKMLDNTIGGIWGTRAIEVNAIGEQLRVLKERHPSSGESVRLTLDLELQKTAERALANRRGAVVVLDVKTGAVLAMASGPTFDPNMFARKMTQADWERLQSPDKPLLNRALQGYPPGSTFKIVTSAAAMESDKFAPYSMLATSNYITVGGFRFHEHSGGYGVIGFPKALAYSSNTFFYQMGLELGPEQIFQWGHNLGIGKTTDLELLGLEGGMNGVIPTPKEKREWYGEPWYVGDTVSMAIGQGLVLSSPLELAVMVASIANGGYRVKPHLLADRTNTPATKPVHTGMSPETVAMIRQGLVAVVQKGTARSLNDASIPLTGGKTGTSEVTGQASHSLYVAFGAASKAEIAIAAIVENGGYGSTAAAPIAKQIFATYYKQKQN
ncbi:MAG: penicillin-binding protein 2 [Oscillatoria sp. SIO1A7]|nr:penicillin-binding protein 2 [Oscillatoria sp. SIO1A7]